MSLFVGVMDMDLRQLLTGDAKQWEIFLVSRMPRLLAILCTGIGMSTAGLIMALLFMPKSTLWGRALFAFAAAILGTWIFVWFIQKIQFKDVVMVPLVGIMFGNVIGGITNYLAYKYEMTQALSS